MGGYSSQEKTVYDTNQYHNNFRETIELVSLKTNFSVFKRHENSNQFQRSQHGGSDIKHVDS